MKYRFRATRAFWRSFTKLPAQQQHRAREAFVVFKQNPFDSRLGTLQILRQAARLPLPAVEFMHRKRLMMRKRIIVQTG